MKHLNRVLVVAASLVVLAVVTIPRSSDEMMPSALSAAEPGRIQSMFESWKTEHESRGGDHNVRVSLGFLKGLSVEHTSARAVATLDLVNAIVSVHAAGLPTHVGDVWLVDNIPGPGRSVRPETGDEMIFLGSVSAPVHHNDVSGLSVALEKELIETFETDTVVVTRRGEDPISAGVLFGSTPLFQRIYCSSASTPLSDWSGPTPLPGSTAMIPSWNLGWVESCQVLMPRPST